jgi:hypothetical protein
VAGVAPIVVIDLLHVPFDLISPTFGMMRIVRPAAT